MAGLKGCGKGQGKGGNACFTAVVLAGERSGGSELTRAAGVPYKALIPVCGMPMLERVVRALRESRSISSILVCGPDKGLFQGADALAEGLKAGWITWVQNAESPSLSALKALELAGGKGPVLLTTADHALLAPEVVDGFCARATGCGCDLAVALAPLDVVKEAYPSVRRTSYRFREGAFCTCNLFGFMDEKGIGVVRFWRQVEERRKSPLKVIGSFGWFWALKYLTGRLALKEAFSRASMLLGCRIRPVVMPFARAAVDVDTPGDLALAEEILGCR